MVKVCAAVMAAQSARPGALGMPGSGALAAAAGPKGKGSGGRHAGSPAALLTWPPMVAEWSGVAGVHVVAPARLLERALGWHVLFTMVVFSSVRYKSLGPDLVKGWHGQNDGQGAVGGEGE